MDWTVDYLSVDVLVLPPPARILSIWGAKDSRIKFLEDFVTYDAVNRTQAASAQRKRQLRRAVEQPMPQLPPPVVVGHGWREELKKTK